MSIIYIYIYIYSTSSKAFRKPLKHAIYYRVTQTQRYRLSAPLLLSTQVHAYVIAYACTYVYEY